jgi:hypothetical protein
MLATTAPTKQKADVRPISFVLEAPGASFRQVTLPVRPEDLSRNEPSRSTVHQTMGRDVKGWVDNFGAGLPSVTISGHTGWRQQAGAEKDGYGSFADLNELVAHAYHREKQLAIDLGMDPGLVKLLFVDLLDNFAWSVEPMQFVLRRSKSRPLLFQYNITLQALSTSVDDLERFLPDRGSTASGLNALDGALDRLLSFADSIESWVSSAVSFVDRALAPIASTIKKFVSLSHKVFSAINSVNVGIRSIANRIVGIASDIAQVGVNVFRTISAIREIPGTLKAQLSRVAGAFNEVRCIFGNSLRQRRVYEDYTGLYGASNCSSTTGGRAPSSYASSNVFELLKTDSATVVATGGAVASIATLSRADPVLAPVPLPELNRQVSIINSGVMA